MSRRFRRLRCWLGFHDVYTCEPECCGKTLCVWCCAPVYEEAPEKRETPDLAGIRGGFASTMPIEREEQGVPEEANDE